MKKLFALILCIATLLSMAACGADREDRDERDDRENPKTTESSKNNDPDNLETEKVSYEEPTAEDWEAIDKYRVIMRALKEYTETGYIYIEYADLGINNEEETASGMDALTLCYEQLETLDAVDKWVGSEYINQEDSRQNYLNRFTVVEDVLLKRECVTKDHLGNESYFDTKQWQYNPDGTVHRVPFESGMGSPALWIGRMLTSQIETNPGQVLTYIDPVLVYDENGQVEEIQYKTDEGVIEAARFFTYAENRVTGEKILYADGREEAVAYSYDSNGLLAQMVYTTGNPRHRFRSVYSYSYNDQGQMVQETISQEKEDYDNEGTYAPYATTVLEYTYDAKGLPVRAVNTDTKNSWDTFEVKTDSWNYTYDEEGRLLAVDISCGNWYWGETGEPTGETNYYAGARHTYQYGNYYIYE